ncbi:hypothetical protein M2280_001126 [Prescottella agglutinans]|uniref:Uncharacterized protein n=1 Tax=Prescottella agglutinans TaxID=1644129 RepID=A0ABT6M6H8_9NOCA|nr:hypothetical protein [Prescottella agglutinans]
MDRGVVVANQAEDPLTAVAPPARHARYCGWSTAMVERSARRSQSPALEYRKLIGHMGWNHDKCATYRPGNGQLDPEPTSVVVVGSGSSWPSHLGLSRSSTTFVHEIPCEDVLFHSPGPSRCQIIAAACSRFPSSGVRSLTETTTVEAAWHSGLLPGTTSGPQDLRASQTPRLLVWRGGTCSKRRAELRHPHSHRRSLRAGTRLWPAGADRCRAGARSAPTGWFYKGCVNRSRSVASCSAVRPSPLRA